MLTDAANLLVDSVYPPRCPLCDAFVERHSAPCHDCEISLQSLDGDAYLPHLNRIYFSKCRSLYAYDGRLKDAIHAFKYGERFDLADFFGLRLAQAVSSFDGLDLIIPVPLHPKRLRDRGFNQSAILARNLGKRLNIKSELDILVRKENIAPQVGLEKTERIKNVRGTFAIDKESARSIEGENALLIDDVLTTGATANECARVLVGGGIGTVSILTIARTL